MSDEDGALWRQKKALRNAYQDGHRDGMLALGIVSGTVIVLLYGLFEYFNV